jgi:hypothetical protein
VHYKIRNEKQYKRDHDNFVYVSNGKITSPSIGRKHSPKERNIESRTKRSRKNTSIRNTASMTTSSANYDRNRETIWLLNLEELQLLHLNWQYNW